MKGNRDRRLTVLVVTMLAFWGLQGCDRAPGTLDDDAMNFDNGGIDDEAESLALEVALDGDEVTAIWPEGWMVAQYEEWIPVLDDLGRRLHWARASFQTGNRSAASAEIRHGIAFLEALVPDASDRDIAALERAISTLWVVADRLSDDEGVTLEQLDFAFANAYRSNLEREAFVVETDSTVPYLDRPETHLEQAMELFLMNEDDGAAREVDRASAYLYLEGNRLGLDERATLIEAAQELEHLAAQLRLHGIRERTELDRIFEPVSQHWLQLAQTSSPLQSLESTE